MRQGDPGEHLGDVAGLGRVGLQERPPHGRVVEEVADLDHRPRRARRSPRIGPATPALDRRSPTPLAASACRVWQRTLETSAIAASASPRKPRVAIRNRSSASASLLVACGLEGQREVVGRHPLAVVGDADEVLPAPLDRHVDPRRPGVDGVLQQFLDHARRPLDHLARGDLVDDRRRQLADDPHDVAPRRRDGHYITGPFVHEIGPRSGSSAESVPGSTGSGSGEAAL